MLKRIGSIVVQYSDSFSRYMAIDEDSPVYDDGDWFHIPMYWNDEMRIM